MAYRVIDDHGIGPTAINASTVRKSRIGGYFVVCDCGVGAITIDGTTAIGHIGGHSVAHDCGIGVVSAANTAAPPSLIVGYSVANDCGIGTTAIDATTIIIAQIVGYLVTDDCRIGMIGAMNATPSIDSRIASDNISDYERR